jgi:hypothetical protein
MKVLLSSELQTFFERPQHLMRMLWVELRGLSTLITRLSPREQRFVTAAGVVLSSMLLYLLVVEPLRETRAQVRARVVAKERELEEVIVLRQTYETLRRELEGARPTSATDFSPFAFLEGVAITTLGRGKLAAINPAGRESRDGIEHETIELRLSGVSLQELVTLLYKIDSAGSQLRCTMLSIKKRYKDPYTFDVTLTARTLLLTHNSPGTVRELPP